uniref:Membrane-associated phosphatidylinositol transfer protein 3 n=1 Tax=Sphaerodactylus townsendi TaxID=933632 RepID=A0ACB8EDB8_9SAUR
MLISLAAEEVAEGKNAILLEMSQWNSNDLVEQIETIGKLEESQVDKATQCNGTYALVQAIKLASVLFLRTPSQE